MKMTKSLQKINKILKYKRQKNLRIVLIRTSISSARRIMQTQSNFRA